MATKTYKPKRKISATESEEIKIPASSVDGLSTVATSGSYNDLSNKPTIPSATEVVQATGQSQSAVMSQKATTDELAKKANLNGENTFTGNQTIQDSQLSVIRDSSQGSGYIFDTYDNNTGANAGTFLGVYQTGQDAGRVIIGEDSTAELTLGGNAGTSGQVLTSQGAGKTPIWTTPAIKSATLSGTTLTISL